MGVAPGEGGSKGCEPKAKQPREQDILPMTASHRLRAIEDELASSAARDLQRQAAEMDLLVRNQGELMRRAILQNFQAKQVQMVASIKYEIFHKIQEKESEIEEINKKNMELEEQVKQLSVDVETWQQQAKDNEDMIVSLKLDLQQAQGANSMEGFGESYFEIDDAASFGSGGDTHEDTKVVLTCTCCQDNEVCMLLLPCRHLCLCEECETKLSFCPQCQSRKMIGMRIFM